MALLYISEYANTYQDHGAGGTAGQEPAITDQTPISTAGASVQSAAFNTNTKLIRVHNDSTNPCCIVFGSNPTATTNNKRLAPNQTEYFGVIPGQKLAVILAT